MKVLLLSALISLSSFALPTAKVIKLKGTVEFEGEKLKVGKLISTSGNIITSKRSFLKIRVDDWGTDIVIGPKSKMKLDLSSKEVKKKYSFLSGACRWVTNKFVDKRKKKGVIYTKTAALGVRGTDFILKANELLGETEIVVLDGSVNFENQNDLNDVAIVNKGQWGGLGGRFGSSIGKIMSLPDNVIQAFDKQLMY